MPFLWFGRKKAAEVAMESKDPSTTGLSGIAAEALELMAAGEFVPARLRLLPLLREEGEPGLKCVTDALVGLGHENALQLLDMAIAGAPNPGTFHLVKGLYLEASGFGETAVKEWEISARLLGDPELLRLVNQRLARFTQE